MKKPVVDYRQFRFSKLNEPEFSHLKLLLGWVIYFAMYFLTENLIPAESCHPVHCFLDDLIPFSEWFFIPYFLWYFLVLFSLLYFALYNVDSFKKLSWFIIITQVVAMAVYIIYPTRQDLRPAVLPDNFLGNCTAFLYAFDTNTGVCPSLHVAYSIGIMSVFLKEKDVARWVKATLTVFIVIICLSTMFLKQHSAVDVFYALLLGLFAEWLVYGKRHIKRIKERSLA